MANETDSTHEDSAFHLSSPLKKFNFKDDGPLPEVLYHYTSARAFQKILSSKSLLLGRLAAMNDSKEFSWFRDIAYRIAEEKRARLLESSTPDPDLRTVIYADLMNRLDGPVSLDPFCVCFSADGDLLSQWRAYADEARGFAIGFSYKAIGLLGFPVFRQVIYDPKEHEEQVHTLYDGFNLSGSGADGYKEALEEAKSAYDSVVYRAFYRKNPHFAEEREYRVFWSISNSAVDENAEMDRLLGIRLKSRFVERRGHLLQYLVLPFSRLKGAESIVRIVLGPRNPARNSPEVLRRFLLAKGYPHLIDEIYESAGTLR